MADKRIITDMAEVMPDNCDTADDLQKELDYYMAVTFNDLLLKEGLLTEEEYTRARREFIETYKPEQLVMML